MYIWGKHNCITKTFLYILNNHKVISAKSPIIEFEWPDFQIKIEHVSVSVGENEMENEFSIVKQLLGEFYLNFFPATLLY